MNENISELRGKLKLNKEESTMVMKKTGEKFVVDSVLGVFKLVPVVNTIIDSVSSYKEEVDKALEAKLLQEYFIRCDEQQNALNELIEFMDEPHGKALYKKITEILVNKLPNEKYCKYIANCLKKIIKENNYSELFEEHSYYLGLLEGLTPQEIIIIGDYKNYPIFIMRGSDAIDSTGRFISEWAPTFAETYIKERNITKNADIIIGTINVLARKGYLVGYYGDDGDKCVLNKSIRKLAEYISE